MNGDIVAHTYLSVCESLHQSNLVIRMRQHIDNPLCHYFCLLTFSLLLSNSFSPLSPQAIDEEEARFHGVRLQSSPPVEALNFGSRYIVSCTANVDIIPKVSRTWIWLDGFQNVLYFWNKWKTAGGCVAQIILLWTRCCWVLSYTSFHGIIIVLKIVNLKGCWPFSFCFSLKQPWDC